MFNKYFELNSVSNLGMIWLIISTSSDISFLWKTIPFAVLYFVGHFIHTKKGRCSQYKNYKDEGK